MSPVFFYNSAVCNQMITTSGATIGLDIFNSFFCHSLPTSVSYSPFSTLLVASSAFSPPSSRPNLAAPTASLSVTHCELIALILPLVINCTEQIAIVENSSKQ